MNDIKKAYINLLNETINLDDIKTKSKEIMKKAKMLSQNPKKATNILNIFTDNGKATIVYVDDRGWSGKNRKFAEYMGEIRAIPGVKDAFLDYELGEGELFLNK